MRSFVLIAAAPLLLTACGMDGSTSNSSVVANTASGAIPDTVEVNGVTYVRADKAGPAPAPSPTTSGNSLFGSSPPPNTGSSTTSSAGGGSVPPNTAPGSSVAADHGE